jgi:hypothetical protein
MIRSSLAVAAVVVLAGCGAAAPDAAPTSDATTRPVSTPTRTVEPTPQGTLDATCDYLLDFDRGHELVATAFVRNTGTIPIEVTVVATWRQAGHDPLGKAGVVTVPVGEEVEVRLQRDATDAQIDRIQALDTDRQCDVEATIS